MHPMEVILKNISSNFPRQTATHLIEMNSLEKTDKKERKKNYELSDVHQ